MSDGGPDYFALAVANNAASHQNARYADRLNDTLDGWMDYARKLEA